MKVLYVTARPPYPPHRGDQLIAYEQIKNLSNKEKFEVFLVSIIRSEKEKQDVENVLGKYCKKIYFVKTNAVLLYMSILKTLYNVKPLQVNMYTGFSIRKQINKIIKSVNPDLIHVQTIRLANLFADSNIPKTLDMIDILSLNMYRRSLKERFILKQILKLESLLLKRYEDKMVKKFNLTSIVSKNDLINSSIKLKDDIIVNPNGTSIIDKPINKNSIKKEKVFLFHGNMSYFPNIEAMANFINEVWPSIVGKYPNYKLYIVGKDPVEKIKKYNGKNNIIVTGFVEDITEYLLKAKIGIYPLNSGTGMQNKILEALACGLPSIASNYAIQGIQGISTNEILIANTKHEYIQTIERLINDDDLRKTFELKGQEFILDNYSWNKNTARLMSMWERAYNSNL